MEHIRKDKTKGIANKLKYSENRNPERKEGKGGMEGKHTNACVKLHVQYNEHPDTTTCQQSKTVKH